MLFFGSTTFEAITFDLFLFGGGDADLLTEDGDVPPEDGDVLPDDGDVLPDDGDVLPEDGEVVSGDEVVLTVGGGLGGHVGGTEYLPPRRLCLLISSRNDIVD